MDLLLLGDTQHQDSEDRSNVALLAAMLRDIDPPAAVGALFLAPDWPTHLLLEAGRTIVDLATGNGLRPILATALGRPPRTPSSVEDHSVGRAAAFDERLDALDRDEACSRAERWIAAERGNALTRAGIRADTWLANAHHVLTDLRAQADEVSRAGGDSPPRSAVRRDVVCEDTDREAERVADAALASGYRGGKIPRSALLVGSPDTCARELSTLNEAGFDQVLVRPVAEGAQALETVQRFFSEVRPELPAA